MHRALLLAATFFAAPAPAADLPAVIVQIKPVGPLFEDIRAGARMVGGPETVKQLDDAMKQALGEKGFMGLDLTRPVVGYAVLTDQVESAEKTPFVFAVPITSEEAFLDLVARANQGKGKAEPVKGKDGLYRLPATRPLNPPKGDAPPAGVNEPSVMRIQGAFAYITQEWNAAALDPAALVAAEKLALPGETALVALRITFDRFPESVRKKFAEGLEKALQDIKNSPLPMENVKNKELAEKAEKMLREMFARYVNQAKEANEATVRMVFDSKSGEAGVEFGLSAKPGTSLAADIAARKPNTNRFAGLIGPQTAAGLKATVPLGQDLRELFAVAIEMGAKEALNEADVPEPARPLVKELLDGLARTFRAGQLDEVIAVNGPDRNGTFTAVAAVSFEDPSRVEKELRTVVKELAPPEVQDLIKFDAAKAGSVNIHRISLPPGQLPPPVETVFGGSAAAGLAFAPNGIYVAFGPDPVGALKAAIAQKPAEARIVDLIVNPARIAGLMRGAAGDEGAAKFVQILGDKDEQFSVYFLSVEGGAELRARIGINIKLIGRIVTQATARQEPGVIKD